MKVYVNSKDDIVEASTDSRGRVYLGTEYADQDVQLAILEAEDDREATHDEEVDLEHCHECGVHETEEPLRGTILRNQPAKLLCGDCYEQERENGNVSELDARRTKPADSRGE